jgi:drug/metabolite transporter (DMT)-like permease
MITFALKAGESLPALSWFGLAVAIAGLIYLVSPGVTSPDPLGAALMTVAGIAWGIYSLLGKTATDPMQSTAYNFIFSVPLAVLASLFFLQDFHVTPRGAVLAIASGAIASGLGYFVWYAALKHLAAIRAATVQLSVPVIAAIGGVVLIAEPMTMRLVIASAATLGGIAIVLTHRQAA